MGEEKQQRDLLPTMKPGYFIRYFLAVLNRATKPFNLKNKQKNNLSENKTSIFSSIDLISSPEALFIFTIIFHKPANLKLSLKPNFF